VYEHAEEYDQGAGHFYVHLVFYDDPLFGKSKNFLFRSRLHAFTLVSSYYINSSLTIHSAYYSLSLARYYFHSQVAMASDFCSNAFDCSIGTAGILCIFASILWCISGFATLALQKKPDPFSNAPVPVISEIAVPTAAAAAAMEATAVGQQVETKSVSPDGTLTTVHTTTITNADGSKTVTETTEVTPAVSY
jgi:hypothetical protein